TLHFHFLVLVFPSRAAEPPSWLLVLAGLQATTDFALVWSRAEFADIAESEVREPASSRICAECERGRNFFKTLPLCGTHTHRLRSLGARDPSAIYRNHRAGDETGCIGRE